MMNDFLVWAEVDLDAIAHNVSAVKNHVGPNVEIIAVVKANGYGHGLTQVALTALKNGATRLALNHIPAAAVLRQAGVRAPILVMGFIPTAGVSQAVAHDLTMTVSRLDLARALSAEGQATGKTVPIHVKVDTGMGRFGLLPAEVPGFIDEINRLPNLMLEGIYTHLATADQVDKHYAYEQLSRFSRLLEDLDSQGIHIPLRHAASSAATLSLKEAHLDAVRLGIAMYGLYPSREVAEQTSQTIPLRPVLSLKSRVGRVHTLPQGGSVSYGQTFVAQQPTPLALVPCGYGDGYMRLTSNRGAVLIHGRRARICGRVCMDQLVVNVSDIPDVKVDDEVILIGHQGGDFIPADEVAAWADTISYEVVTHLLPRVPRVYLRNGKVESIMEGW